MESAHQRVGLGMTLMGKVLVVGVAVRTSESGVWSNGKDGVVVIVADDLWEEWGTWSVCSVSCRGQGQIGTRQRFRSCNSFNEDDRSNCYGENTETVQCSGDSLCTDGNFPYI